MFLTSLDSYGIDLHAWTIDMPLRGSAHSALVGDESPYFVSLSALDNWASTPKQRLSGCLPYIPRSPIPTAPPNRGRLLVSRYPHLRASSINSNIPSPGLP